MFKKKGEWLPWYRQKGFRGKLTEEEKRILDSFRIGDNHPAAKFDELPEEVQDYILELEGDISDKGQSEAGVILMIGVYVAGYIAYRAYTGGVISTEFPVPKALAGTLASRHTCFQAAHTGRPMFSGRGESPHRR